MRAGNRAHHCEMVWSQAVKKSLVRFHASGRRLPSEGECLASPGEWSLLSFRMFIKQRSQRQFWIPPASGKLAMESILPIYLAPFARVLLSVGNDANDQNLLQRGALL